MNTDINTTQPQVSLKWIAGLRIVIGLVFLSTWLFNFLDGFYTPDGLLKFFTEIFPQSENSLSWYAAFINNIILPIGLCLLRSSLSPSSCWDLPCWLALSRHCSAWWGFSFSSTPCWQPLATTGRGLT